MAKLGAIGGVILMACLPTLAQQASAFRTEHEAWRARRLAALTQGEGWLSVVGLDWLSAGDNTLGSSKDVKLALPAKAPALVGTIRWEGDKLHFKAAPGVVPTADGKPFVEGDLLPETASSTLSLGDLRMSLIQRGKRIGLRVRDTGSEMFQKFKGIPAFTPDPAWRVMARFEAYEKPKDAKIATVIGTPMDAQIPGRVTFTLEGKALSLEPVLEDDHLFFIFRDKTAGHETYPAGRFLYAAMPKDGVVILDFNRAENPPCAFTEYATCPLAPDQNVLPIAVRAGEQDPHLH